jgi:RNAse (barnase) inhibitor barstar
MIDFIIPVFVGIVLGVMILQVINAYRAWRELDRMSDDLSKQLDELVDKLENQKLIILEVEAVDGQFMCYNTLTKEFVCMGRNMDEVQERFRQRYPHKEAAVIKEDPVAQQLKAT